MIIKFKKLHENAKEPTKANDTDAGWDLYALDNDVVHEEEIAKVHTGIAVSIPLGYVGVIKDRSSVGSKGVAVLGGVVDSGYTGEIMIILYNGNKYSKEYKDKKNFEITKGNKIAQMLILPVPDVEFVEVDELEQTQRAEKGFGSSGK